MKKIIIFLIVIIILGLLFFINDKNKDKPALIPMSEATYVCNEGRRIEATFYKGEEKQIELGEMSVPSGSVKVVLSDGRNFNLSQTISADGGRYTNRDESFVFWIKGDTVLVLENSIEKDYSGCVLVPKDGIVVVSPNGGEVWLRGQEVKISWNTGKEVEFVNIRLVIAGDEDTQSFNAAIASNISNTGNYEWTVQELFAEVLGIKELPVSNKYLIIIEDSKENNVYDASDLTFSITNTATEKACIDSGGTIKREMCCLATIDFPNTCFIGACGCSPDNSHEVNICSCGEGRCFNGEVCISQRSRP